MTGRTTLVSDARCGDVRGGAVDRVGRYQMTCCLPAGHPGPHRHRWVPIADGRPAGHVRRHRDRDWFDDLVIRDAFGRTTDIEAARLRDDTQLEQFYATLVRLVETLDGQLAAHKARVAAGEQADLDWRRRTLTLRWRLICRIREVKPAVKALRRRRSGAKR